MIESIIILFLGFLVFLILIFTGVIARIWLYFFNLGLGNNSSSNSTSPSSHNPS